MSSLIWWPWVAWGDGTITYPGHALIATLTGAHAQLAAGPGQHAELHTTPGADTLLDTDTGAAALTDTSETGHAGGR